ASADGQHVCRHGRPDGGGLQTPGSAVVRVFHKGNLASAFRRSCTDGAIQGCERCLVELADDRFWRATRQDDAEPGGRCKIREPPAREPPAHRPIAHGPIAHGALARFGKAAYTLVRGDVISSSHHFNKERLRGWKRTSRRELLKGGAAVAGGLTLGDIAALQAQAHDHPPTPSSKNDHPMILGSKEL